jgi:hypothetical protein
MTAIHGAAPPAYLNPPVLDQGTQPAVPLCGASESHTRKEVVHYGSPVRLSGHAAPGDYRVLCREVPVEPDCVAMQTRPVADGPGGIIFIEPCAPHRMAANLSEFRAEGGCNHHSMSPHTRRNQKPGGRFPSFPADKDASVATFLAHETRPPAGAIIPCRLRAPLPPLGYPPLCLGSQGGAAR